MFAVHATGSPATKDPEERAAAAKLPMSATNSRTTATLSAVRKTKSIAHTEETNMALLEITQSRQITATIRLDEKVAAQVDQYAAFIHAPADEVVNHALNYVFSKDRDFQ